MQEQPDFSLLLPEATLESHAAQERRIVKTRFSLSVWLAVVGGALAPVTSQATLLTNSTQLFLSGPNVISLAAVHFYYSNAPSSLPATNQVTAPVQGVTVQNLNVLAYDNVPFALSGGGTLTANLPFSANDTGSARSQTPNTTITGMGADEAPTEDWVRPLVYFDRDNLTTATLSFQFGLALSNVPVTVQILGGDAGWANGTLNAKLGGFGNPVVASFTTDGTTTTADIMTFDATTDGAGNLNVYLDMAGSAGRFAGLSGVIVAIPEPSTVMLAGAGALLVAWSVRRRRS